MKIQIYNIDFFENFSPNDFPCNQPIRCEISLTSLCHNEIFVHEGPILLIFEFEIPEFANFKDFLLDRFPPIEKSQQ